MGRLPHPLLKPKEVLILLGATAQAAGGQVGERLRRRNISDYVQTDDIEAVSTHEETQQRSLLGEIINGTLPFFIELGFLDEGKKDNEGFSTQLLLGWGKLDDDTAKHRFAEQLEKSWLVQAVRNASPQTPPREAIWLASELPSSSRVEIMPGIAAAVNLLRYFNLLPHDAVDSESASVILRDEDHGGGYSNEIGSQAVVEQAQDRDFDTTPQHAGNNDWRDRATDEAAYDLDKTQFPFEHHDHEPEEPSVGSNYGGHHDVAPPDEGRISEAGQANFDDTGLRVGSPVQRPRAARGVFRKISDDAIRTDIQPAEPPSGGGVPSRDADHEEPNTRASSPAAHAQDDAGFNGGKQDSSSSFHSESAGPTQGTRRLSKPLFGGASGGEQDSSLTRIQSLDDSPRQPTKRGLFSRLMGQGEPSRKEEVRDTGESSTGENTPKIKRISDQPNSSIRNRPTPSGHTRITDRSLGSSGGSTGGGISGGSSLGQRRKSSILKKDNDTSTEQSGILPQLMRGLTIKPDGEISMDASVIEALARMNDEERARFEEVLLILKKQHTRDDEEN